MSDPFLLTVAKAVDIGRHGIASLIKQGFTVDDFAANADAAVTFKYLLDYHAHYTDSPTPATIKGEIDVDLPAAPPEPLSFWRDKVREIRLHKELIQASHHFESLLDLGQTEDAFKFLGEAHVQLRALQQHKEAGVIPVFARELRQRVKQRYELMRSGVYGVPCPWPSLNKRMTGMWPEELCLLVARTGVGKTWALLVWAIHAWRKGHRVLFVTTELSQETITTRSAALDLNLEYDRFRRGRLTKFDHQSFVEWADAPDTDMPDGFYQIGGDFKFDIATLEAAIDEVKPDILLIDGVYLFEGQGRNRSERAADNFNQVKMLLKRKHIPGVVSTQLNRQAAKPKKKGGGAQVHHISLSDAGGWNADYILALEQTQDQKAQGEMTIKPLKGREVPLPEILSNWRFDNMDFTEVKKAGDGDTEEDEFDYDDLDDDLPF